MRMNFRRVLMTFLIIMTVALSIGAVVVGWRLANQDNTGTVDTPAACTPTSKYHCEAAGECPNDQGKFCEWNGSYLAGGCVVADACAPATHQGASCTGTYDGDGRRIFRFSTGESGNGSFVGCSGAMNCFCGGPATSTNPPVGSTFSSGTVTCMVDAGADSCGRGYYQTAVATNTPTPRPTNTPVPTTPGSTAVPTTVPTNPPSGGVCGSQCNDDSQCTDANNRCVMGGEGYKVCSHNICIANPGICAYVNGAGCNPASTNVPTTPPTNTPTVTPTSEVTPTEGPSPTPSPSPTGTITVTVTGTVTLPPTALTTDNTIRIMIGFAMVTIGLYLVFGTNYVNLLIGKIGSTYKTLNYKLSDRAKADNKKSKLEETLRDD